MQKRLLSVLMSIMLMFSLLPLPSFAMQTEDKVSNNIVLDDTNKENDNENSNSSNGDNLLESDKKEESDNAKSSQLESLTNEDDEHSAEKEKWIKHLQENQIDYEEEGDSKELSQKLNEDDKYVISLDEESVSTSPLISFRSAQATKSKNKIKKRYSVLVLDASSSMSGSPMSNMKIASKKFFESVLKDKSENYIALVPYGGDVTTITDFTKDKKELNKVIDELSTLGYTNTNSGLISANSLLSKIPDEDGVIKNIILLSDGLPNLGDTVANGKYDYTDHYNYAYANACYETASKLKSKNYKIYTLGFFHSLRGKELAFGRRFMSDLQNSGYYDVDDPNKLEFVFGEIANEITEITGKFKYPGTVGNRDYEETYFYKDSYFKDTSYKYNQQLATMSLCLELASWASSDEPEYINKTVNARNLLTEIGFSNFAQNTFYDNKPKKDSIGAIAASKKITVNAKPYTLIALAVRGGGYESEWASNFTMGEQGYHQGFREARDNVIKFLQKYIEENNIEGDIKLWITGYSRAGGTANLVAGKINEGTVPLKKCRLIPDDMYAYTFEAPQGALEQFTNKQIHDNIFNRVNLDDPVPYVAPEHWKFKRYGVDKYFPHPTRDYEVYDKEIKNMKKKFGSYDSVAGVKYIVDKFSVKKPDVNIRLVGPILLPNIKLVDDKQNNTHQGLFLREFLNSIVKEKIGTRKVYVEKYEDGIREILGLIYKLDNEQKEKFKKVFIEELKQIAIDFLVSKIKGTEMTDTEVENRVRVSLEKSFKFAGVTSYNLNSLISGAKAIADLLIKTVKSNPNSALTAFANAKGILQAHYPEICLAWMQSMDSNYVSGAKVRFSTGKGRKIRINCPVDVEIYNTQTNTLVAQIVSDELVDVGSGLSYGINEDGEKFAFLPSDAQYNVKIKATGDGTLNYNITEDVAGEGIVRIINYYDIPIKTGMQFSSILPAYSDEDIEERGEQGSSRVYSFENLTENKTIAQSNEFRGDKANEATYYITVETEDESKGLAWGSGSRIIGSFAKPIAWPRKGYKLEGWYENGKKVSSDSEYRVRADRDITLVAKFEIDPNDNEQNNTNTGGGSSRNRSSEKQDDVKTPKTEKIQNENKDIQQLTDVNNHWAKEYIKYALQNKIVAGYLDNTFKPNKSATRAEFLRMLINAKGYEETKYQGKFSDVKQEDWYSGVIQTGIDKGIVFGYKDGTFKPNQTITRAEMISMIMSLEQVQDLPDKEVEQILSNYKDKKQVPSWAKNQIAKAIQMKMLTGYDGKIHANKKASRAEIVAVLYTLLHK